MQTIPTSKASCGQRFLAPIRLALASAAAWIALAGASAFAQSDCQPLPPDAAKLVVIRQGYHRVEGPLAPFDPCHRSVQLSMPGLFADKLADKPPLMIIAHGGGGPGAGEAEMVRRMNSHGVATLLFDAYEMNGFSYRGTFLFLTGTTNESRQRMIFKATLGAYEWAKQHARIDSRRIFIHGVSNGGTVALNMAGAGEPEHLRAVFAEGPPSAGIGLPDRIRVPLKLVFGRLDNYGGKAADDWMYTRTEPCMLSAPSPDAPEGSTQRCSFRANPQSLSPSPQAWGEALQAQGAPVEIWFYDDAAHGLLAGPINRGMRTYGAGATAQVRYGWTGASRDAANRFVADVMKVVRATYP